MCEFTKQRSRFWLKIYDNEGSINVTSNTMVKNLIAHLNLTLESQSPKGWNPSEKYPDIHNLWIPNNNIIPSELESLKTWANKANSHIWLSTNKHTEEYFDKTELDYCIACDWNYDFSTACRTDLGEAEYQLKYHSPYGTISAHDKTIYVNRITKAIVDTLDCFPFNLQDYFVTTIPATADKQTKFSWNLAKYVANYYNIDLMGITLVNEKPQMKEQQISSKINIWRDIYSTGELTGLPKNFYGKNVLIVDDLYQSGASMWCFAEYLKEHGANSVIGVTAVKAQKDGDNID